MTQEYRITLNQLQATAAERKLTEEELVVLDELAQAARDLRLPLDRTSTQLKTVEDGAKSLLVDQLLKGDVKSFAHEGFTISVAPAKYVPHVDDWQAFQKHILAMEDFSLLERRVSKAAVQERWDSGATVPGVQKYPVFELQRTKVKANG